MSEATMRDEDAYTRERNAIAARPCECVPCADCYATGRVAYRTGGYPEEGLETCDTCEGSGIVHECDRCAELTELEDAFR